MHLSRGQGTGRSSLASQPLSTHSSLALSVADGTSDVSDVSQSENGTFSSNIPITSASATLTDVKLDFARLGPTSILKRYLTDHDRLEQFFASPLTPIGEPSSQWSALKQIYSVIDEVGKAFPPQEIVAYRARIRVSGENAPWDVRTGEERTTPLRGRRIRQHSRRRQQHSRLSRVQSRVAESRDAAQTSNRRSTQASQSENGSTGIESQDPNMMNSHTHGEEFFSFSFTNSSTDNRVDDFRRSDLSPMFEEDVSQVAGSVVPTDPQQGPSHIWPLPGNRAPDRLPTYSDQFYIEQQTASADTVATSFDSSLSTTISPPHPGTSHAASTPNTTIPATNLAPVPRPASTLPALSPNYSSSSYSDAPEGGREGSSPGPSNTSLANAAPPPPLPLTAESADKQAGNASVDLEWMGLMEDRLWE